MQNEDILPFPDDTTPLPAVQTVEHWSKYPAVLTDLQADQYHRHPAVSKHGLDAFRKAPALYMHERKNPAEPTPTMLFGSLYHTACLEPETIYQHYAVVPKDAPTKPTGRQRSAKKPSLETLEAIVWWDEFLDQNNGKTIIAADDLQKTLDMLTAIQRHVTAWNAISKSRLHVEASLFWEDPTTGVKCRARPDLIRTDGFLVDLKTCADASLDEFTRSAYNFGYHRQAAFYLDAWQLISGEKPKGFIFVAQGKEPPFLTAVYVASPQMIELGRAEIAADLARFRECQLSDTWPGLPLTPQELNLPTWAMPKAA